jgi:hypothetical protein
MITRVVTDLICYFIMLFCAYAIYMHILTFQCGGMVLPPISNEELIKSHPNHTFRPDAHSQR